MQLPTYLIMSHVPKVSVSMHVTYSMNQTVAQVIYRRGNKLIPSRMCTAMSAYVYAEEISRMTHAVVT